MQTITPQTDLPGVLRIGRTCAALYQERFAALTDTQLNWTPEPGEWSIGTCVEHVMVVNRSYFPVFAAISSGNYRPSWPQRIPVLPGLIGPLLMRSLAPGAGSRISAPRSWQPPTLPVTTDLLPRFSAHLSELFDHVDNCRIGDNDAVVIASPAAPFLSYRLGDAWRIIVLHMQHHLEQASQVAAQPTFPRAG